MVKKGLIKAFTNIQAKKISQFLFLKIIMTIDNNISLKTKSNSRFCIWSINTVNMVEDIWDNH